MKFESKTNTKEFEPITFTITIESIAELAELAARFNMGSGTLKRSDSSDPYPEVAGNDFYNLWEHVDNLYNEVKSGDNNESDK